MKTNKLINIGLLIMLLLGTSNAFSNTDILGNTTPEAEAAPPDFYYDTDDVPEETLPIDMGLSYLTIGGILLVGFLMHKKVMVKNQKN
jgi:hypothetical protein